MTTSTTTRVISYFFIVDFYHMKKAGADDEIDIVSESIIYFYPPKTDIKRQKSVDCAAIIGLMQFFKYDLFSSYPKEFNYKKSLVTIEHYGRHSAFLVLSKDRFTIDEANIHLTHILQLFNILHGTFNYIQSTRSDINQMHVYLKQTLTPIVEYVFNENRSVRNLFSTIDYASLQKNNQLCLLQVKHFLNYLRSEYKIKNGFFAYEKKILYSSFDIDITYYIQVILDSERILKTIEKSNSSTIETKLRNGVSLIKIYIRRPPSLESVLNAVNNTTNECSNNFKSSESIRISPSINLNKPEQLSLSFGGVTKSYSTSYVHDIREDPAGSSEDTTGFDTDLTGDTSPLSKNDETGSISSLTIRKHPNRSSKANSISNNLKEDSLTDHQKEVYQYVRERRGTLSRDFEESIKPEQDSKNPRDSLDRVVFQPMPSEIDSDDCGDCGPDDHIYLPPKAIRSTFQRSRRKTITNAADMRDTEYNNSNDQQDASTKWGDTPDKNDEMECDEFVLYVQRNARMIFAGIIEQRTLSEEYLQKLWSLILTGMADFDREIQVIPIVGETNKHNSDIKFQFNDNTHQVQYERLLEMNKYYDKIPSSDTACMACTARIKMNENPERKMIGLSRGNNLISINRNLPDRITYFCRRFQEQH